MSNKFVQKLHALASSQDHTGVVWHMGSSSRRWYVAVTDREVFRTRCGSNSVGSWRRNFSAWGFRSLAKSKDEFLPGADAQYRREGFEPATTAERLRAMRRPKDEENEKKKECSKTKRKGEKRGRSASTEKRSRACFFDRLMTEGPLPDDLVLEGPRPEDFDSFDDMIEEFRLEPEPVSEDMVYAFLMDEEICPDMPAGRTACV